MSRNVTIYLTPFQSTPDTWHTAFAAAVESHLDNAGLVLDGHTGDVRHWREGDDEDDAVEALAFYVRPPHEAPKGSVLGVWLENGSNAHLRGADLEAELLEAYNMAQVAADKAANSTFKPTHKITITGTSSILADDGVVHADEGQEILVQEEDYDEGGRILYTQEEWDAGVPADWELDADGRLLFQGGAYPGTGLEVRISRL